MKKIFSLIIALTLLVSVFALSAVAFADAEARTVTGMPVAIVMKTTKGKGVSFMENNAGWHGKAPNDEEYAIAMAELEKVGEALCQK